MWFILALVAALAWGGTDYFAKRGTCPSDKYSHWRMAVMVGAVMGLHAAAMMIYNYFSGGETYSLKSIITYLPVSSMYILSMMIGYVGLRYLELSIISPVQNMSGAIVPILCFVFLDETMTPVQLVFVIAILAGILSLAIVEKRADDGLDREAPHEQETRKGKSDKYRFGALALIFPICYAVIDSLGTFFDSYYLDGDEPILSEFQANTSYELTFLLVGIFALIYLTAVKKQKFSFWGERIFGASALCETAGQFAYIYAIASNSIVAVPVVASYSIFSLLYSRVFLKEKLSLPHYICIAVVVAGIVGLGVLEGLAEA